MKKRIKTKKNGPFIKKVPLTNVRTWKQSRTQAPVTLVIRALWVSQVQTLDGETACVLCGFRVRFFSFVLKPFSSRDHQVQKHGRNVSAKLVFTRVTIFQQMSIHPVHPLAISRDGRSVGRIGCGGNGCCCCCCCCCRNDLASEAAAAIRLRCTRPCLARWSDRENRLSHTSQPYGLTPECERQWRDSSSDREKRHAQPGHMQPYGFSPECLRMCTCDGGWGREKKSSKLEYNFFFLSLI